MMLEICAIKLNTKTIKMIACCTYRSIQKFGPAF